MRTIIPHYHLFKNARTSIDKILKNNFGDKRVTREFTGSNNTDEVTDWILSNPDVIAFSGHTMNGPEPKTKDIKIISITMLRNPVQRIISAYKFELHQDADTWGHNLPNEPLLKNMLLQYCKSRVIHNAATSLNAYQRYGLAIRPRLNER